MDAVAFGVPRGTRIPPSVAASYPTLAAVQPVLFLDARTRVPPFSSALFKGRAPAGYKPGEDIDIDPLVDDPRWDAYPGLMVHRGTRATIGEDGKVDVLVTNPHEYPVTVGELTPFALVTESRLVPEFTAKEIVTQINVADRVANDEHRMAIFTQLWEKHANIVRSSLEGNYCHVAQHHIELEEGARPVRAAPHIRRMSRLAHDG